MFCPHGLDRSEVKNEAPAQVQSGRLFFCMLWPEVYPSLSFTCHAWSLKISCCHCLALSIEMSAGLIYHVLQLHPSPIEVMVTVSESSATTASLCLSLVGECKHKLLDVSVGKNIFCGESI